MHTLLLAVLTLSVVQKPADACGGRSFGPDPIIVFTLTGHRDDARAMSRTFALLDQAPTGIQAWRRMAPGSYDYAQIADASPLATPMTITLVGPSGTRVVTSKDRAFIKDGFSYTKPTAALELHVGRGEFRVALAGDQKAKWIGLDTEMRGTNADLDWVTKRGVAAPDLRHVHVRRLGGTPYETVSVIAETGLITLVRFNGSELGRFEGSAIGAVVVKGFHFVLSISNKRDGVVLPTLI